MWYSSRERVFIVQIFLKNPVCIYIYIYIYERGVPGGALNLNSTGYPDHGRNGDLSLQGKIPTAEPGIEPRTSWLVVRSSDPNHKAGHEYEV
jgi:hypothetical protein